MTKFRDDLQKLINTHSMENGSKSPDYLLAEYLTDCLAAFDKAVTERDRWYGRAETTNKSLKEFSYKNNPLVNWVRKRG